MSSPRILEIRRGVLEKNDLLAGKLRERFRTAGVYAVNLVSGPGAGKTALLESTLRKLRASGRKAAALVGDLATDNDAQRLARSGAPVRQIETGDNCHLEASMIGEHLDAWGLELNGLDFLFIENVGNLVCPAGYDLGEALRVVLFSVTDGEDKPLKYPTMFHSADLVLISKSDLAEAVEFDRKAALANVQSVHPGIRVIETSSKRESGLDEWINFLNSQHENFR